MKTSALQTKSISRLMRLGFRPYSSPKVAATDSRANETSPIA